MNKDTIHVLNKTLQLKQLADGFKTSADSVLLAAACPAKSGETVLDLGCGIGSAGLCVLKRVPGIYLTGIDIQREAIALAEENAALNGLKEQCSFYTADIKSYKNTQAFDHVICNPPFLEAGTHLTSPSESLAQARGHNNINMSLTHWIDCGFYNLKQKGSLTLIQRADHADKIIRALGKRFGAVEIIPLWPKAGQAARRVIIRAVRNRKSGATIHPGLVLHERGGAYTRQAEKILREGRALFIQGA